METVLKKIDQITDFKEALKAFASAKNREARLKVKYQSAHAREYIASNGSTHSIRNMKATAKTEKEVEAFELATVEATALQYLVEHLKGGDDQGKTSRQRSVECVGEEESREEDNDEDCLWHDFK